MQTKHHELKDGRILAYCEYGDPLGTPTFYAHGGPGSRLEGEFFNDEAARRGYRFITTDRPGMGESSYLANRQLLDYPRDIAQLADALGIEKFGVMGWSGGGAHTTVCAYALPERLLFNMSFAGYTNFAELPNAESYLKSRLDQWSVELSKKSPRLFKFFFDLMGLGVNYMPKSTFKGMLKTMSEADNKIAGAPGFSELFISDQREAFRQGARGVTTDAAVHYIDWGFKLAEIRSTIHVFHGASDQLVPPEYGKHLKANVANCELHWLENEGHFFPIKYQSKIFDVADLEVAKVSCGNSETTRDTPNLTT